MAMWEEKAENFDFLQEELRSRVGTSRGPYYVPEILAGGTSARVLVDVGDPYRFYLGHLDRIRTRSLTTSHEDKGPISVADVVYLTYMRTFAALNGEIGTCLKQIVFLSLLQDNLGITIFLTLPVSTIGAANRKGVRGSPFAVADPFDVDLSLADPLLPSITALVQYKALLEACGLLGIRTGSVVPLATVAIDASLIQPYPDLVFWWRAAPGEELMAGDLDLSSDDASRDTQRLSTVSERFVRAPAPEAVRLYARGDEFFYTATVTGEQEGLITVANATPDVIAGDAATYTWKDVASVNYTYCLAPSPMGTLPAEQIDRTRPAWKVMPWLLAWRAQTLGEEVFLVDVSGSVPEEILQWGRNLSEEPSLSRSTLLPSDMAERLPLLENNPFPLPVPPDAVLTPAQDRRIRFVAEDLWSLDAQSHIVDAVVGPFIFGVSAHTRNASVFLSSLRHHLALLEHRQAKNLYFVGAGNHDTMPVVPGYGPLLYAFYNFLPGSLPMVFSGTEFHAQDLTNKEFGFDSSEELLQLRRSLRDEDLGLFNDRPINREALPTHDTLGRPLIDMFDLMPRLIRLRAWYARAVPSSDFRFLAREDGWGEQACTCAAFFGYSRTPTGTAGGRLTVLANWSEQQPVAMRWPGAPADLILSLGSAEHPPRVHSGDLVQMPPLSLVVLVTGTRRCGGCSRDTIHEVIR